MSKFLAATVLALAALSQSVSTASAQGQMMGQKGFGVKIGVARPMFKSPIMVKPIVVKPIFGKPMFGKPIVQPIFGKPIFHRPIMYRPVVTLKPAYFHGSYKPMYRYFPLAAYGYDSAPKHCALMLHKTHYGLIKKVWRCMIVDHVQFGSVKTYEPAPAKVVELVEPAPTKIIERTIERHTIEKQVPVAPVDDTLPPK